MQNRETRTYRIAQETKLYRLGFPRGSVVKNPLARQRHRFDPWVRKIPWRRKWQPTSVFLPGKSHGQKSLAGYCPPGHKKNRTYVDAKQNNNYLIIKF